jgi:membrane protein YqaA with SNARE-associated domain
LVVFVTALAPNPFFKVVGVIAGASHMPILGFSGACFLGKTLRFWAIAALGVPLFSLLNLPSPGAP